jgi:hypothetical protein
MELNIAQFVSFLIQHAKYLSGRARTSTYDRIRSLLNVVTIITIFPH